MLVELADDLERDDVRFAVARSIGDVRDVLDASEPEAAIWPTYPNVRAAVAALSSAAAPGSSPHATERA